MKNSKNIKIFIADQRVTSIPIKGISEPLVDLAKQNIIYYYKAANNTKEQSVKLRLTVYEKLIKAQQALPDGLYFCVYEGYRSLADQSRLFIKKFAQLYLEDPNSDYENLFIKTMQLVSPVINIDGSLNVPPHVTGAAFDIFLVNKIGEPLDMGIHPQDSAQDVNGVLSATLSDSISMQAKIYRKIMYNTLIKFDFINYFTEYWHWSYGDRFWAYHKNSPHALYDIYQE